MALNKAYSGILVTDLKSIIQETIVAEESIEQTLNQIKQIENQIKQLENFEKEFASMTGNYNMGAFLNGAKDQEALKLIPRNWRETLKMVNNGGSSGNFSGYKKAIDTYKKGQYFSRDDIYRNIKGSPGIDADRYDEETESIYGPLAASITSIEKTEERLNKIAEMSKEIDKAHDPKAAADLANRIGVETNYMLTQVLLQMGINGTVSSYKRQDNQNKRKLNDHFFNNDK